MWKFLMNIQDLRPGMFHPKADLVKGVADDFNVHLIQILLRDAVLKESSWNKKK